MLIKSIIDQHNIFNISLVFNQSLILLVCNEYIKFYRINGEHIHSIKHDVKEFCILFIFILYLDMNR